MKKPFINMIFVLISATLACANIGELPIIVTVTPQVPAIVTPAPDISVPSTVCQPILVQVGYGCQGSFYEIYFTDPFNRDSAMDEGGIDVPMAAAIDNARQSVDVAIYSFSLPSLRTALINAHNRGVTVRIVMESDSMDRTVPQSLIDAGIPVIGDRREGLMHNKFIIIDRSEVWLGSMNFTVNGAYDDNNHMIRIRSTKIAENYLTEFEEMFTGDFFGTDVVAATPNPVVAIDGIHVETYFSPDDKVARRIVELLQGANHSIYFMAYSFTADDFANAIIGKAQAGLTIAGVMEEEQAKSNQGGEFTNFQQNGLDVYLDGNSGQMHHKIFIIDEQIVILGSYNFSASAERRNDENVMIIFDTTVAQQYLSEFQRVYAEAQK